jgi:two-component system sensor histidine kinase RegB
MVGACPENPRVGSSILPLATIHLDFFYYLIQTILKYKEFSFTLCLLNYNLMMFKDILKLVLLGRFFLIFFFLLLLFILKIYSYPAPFYSLFFLLFISGLFNFNYFFRKKFTNYDKYFFLQLNLDLTWISLFFYFLGGYHNPLIFLMLLPLVSAALILNKRYLTIYFVEYIIIFILICFNSKPLSHLLMNYYGGISGNLYLWGVLISFLIVSLVIVFNLFWIIKLNKINEKEFSQAKEVLLKKDKNILLTTFAATTAHQLGTPLAIIAMKYEELKKFIKDKNAEMALNEIKAQIFKCKDIIKSINNFETSIKYKKLSLNN